MAEKTKDLQENKMGVMPVGKLLFTMSMPMIMSMLMQALYNIVDSIFVAMLNEEALTAVSLAFPIQNLMISLGVGTGVGVSALISRHLGEKDFERANSVATHGIRLAFLTSIAFALLILAFGGPFFRVLSDDEVIVGYGLDYARVIGYLCIGLFFQTMGERLLQSTGRTFYSMLIQMTGAIVNLILDPILIFGLLGLPRLEVAGAALATVIGQVMAALLGMLLNLKRNPEIRVSLRDYPFSGKIVKSIYVIGVPSIIMASVGSVMVFGYNKILMTFSATAAAVFGVYFRLQSFAFMPVFGLNNGMVPIVAYNYGAARPERIKRTIQLSIIAATCIMIAAFIVFQLLPVPLLRMFSASDNMIAIGIPALRVISISFLFAGFCIMASAAFQALGKSFISMINSILRQLVVLLPSAYILSKLGGLDAVWWSFPISEGVVFIINIYLLRRLYRRTIDPLAERG